MSAHSALLEEAAEEVGLGAEGYDDMPGMTPMMAAIGAPVESTGVFTGSASAGASVPTMGMMSGRPVAPKPVDPATIKHYIQLYPCYFNANKKMSEGRRLPLHLLTGCIDPHPHDIGEACQRLGFKSICVENKRHPRDFTSAGRIRIELKDTEGVYTVPAITSKEMLLPLIAKIIPTLESRRMRIAQMAAQRAEYERQVAAAKAPKKDDKKKAAAGKKKGK